MTPPLGPTSPIGARQQQPSFTIKPIKKSIKAVDFPRRLFLCAGLRDNDATATELLNSPTVVATGKDQNSTRTLPHISGCPFVSLGGPYFVHPVDNSTCLDPTDQTLACLFR